MTSPEERLIAKQALKIEDLERLIERLKEDRTAVHRMLVGVGGPLNDNVLQFTTKQLVLFARIEQHVGSL